MPLGSSDEDRRRHRTSGAEKEAEEEENVWSRRRRSCQPEMSDHGCIHLNNFKAAKGIQPYKVIHAYFVTSTSTEARIRKVRPLLFLSRAISRSRFPLIVVTPFSRPSGLPHIASRSRARTLIMSVSLACFRPVPPLSIGLFNVSPLPSLPRGLAVPRNP